MLGMTTLLPWNFFIAVNDYWNYKVGGRERYLVSYLKSQPKYR